VALRKWLTSWPPLTCGATFGVPAASPQTGTDSETFVFRPGDVRRLSWRLRLVQLRQSARQAYDLMHLGQGTVERLCAALLLAAAFFLVGFVVAILVARIGPAYALALAGGALVVVFLPGALLVLGPSDEELEGRRGELNCPYCDEVILARAVKCKHCGELLAGPVGVPTGRPMEGR
jgi:hypothetical protein